MEYDVYYSTGGGSLVGGGADVWVNHWIESIAPHLKVKPRLLIHRTKPKVPLTTQQTKKFENSVLAGRGGNQGRVTQKKIEKNYKEVLKEDLEHYWQGDDIQKFKDLLNGARRINILHGYYSPHKYILDNIDKIHSNAVHVSVKDILSASVYLDLDKSFHTYCEESWEDSICKAAKHPFWIGVGEKELTQPTEHIPNFYEFKYNYDVNDSNMIGFAARMETRKCPHFIEDLEAMVFTSSAGIKWWKRHLNLDTSKWKHYQYTHDNTENFFKKDWGVSHSAHIFEPFGYSIFQAIDFGKIPILAHDWMPKYDYPLRASSIKEFHEQYDRVCKMGLEERRDILFPLREYLNENFGNKNQWVENMLRIYNE